MNAPLHERTLHYRYWAYDNVYATENGGEDTFIMDSSYPRGAVPVGDDFW